MARYEPDELPGCSTPHLKCSGAAARRQILRTAVMGNAITSGDRNYRQAHCMALELELALFAAGVAVGVGAAAESLISMAQREKA